MYKFNPFTSNLDFYESGSTPTEYNAGNSGSALTINWTNSSRQTVTLTANCTFTFSSGSAGNWYALRLVQDNTGSRTVTWPAGARWPNSTVPTLSTLPQRVDIIYFYFDGTYYYGNSELNYITSRTPLSSANAKIVFESDVNVTNSSGNASQWVDQKSGITISQSTGASQPVINPNALNGLQTLTFNGSTTRLTAASQPYKLSLSSAFSFYIVAKPAAFTGTQYFCSFTLPTTVSGNSVWMSLDNDSGAPNQDIQFAASDNGSTIALQRSGTIGLDTSAFRVYKVFYNGSGGTTLTNFGYQKDSGSILTPVTGGGAVLGTTTLMSVGVRYADGGSQADSWFKGDIAAIYSFATDTRSSGSNEDTLMMSYLQAKYGAGI